MSLNQPINILIVEDNPGDARLIREMLRSVAAYQVTHVERLADGLIAAQEITFDLALIDLSLPDSSGVETVHRFKEDLAHLPLVVLTGSHDEQLGIAAVQAGAQDYLIKGEVDGRGLQRSIQYARERHRSEETIRRSEQAYRSLIVDVFNTSMVGVLILDPAFHVVWMNDVVEIYFGVTRQDILDQDKRVLIDTKLKCIFADPDDYSARLLRAYESSDFTDRFECHVMAGEHRDERWLEHWSQPIHDGVYAGGRIEQYNDITARKHAEFAEIEQYRFAEALRNTAEGLTSTLEMDVVLDRVLENIDQVVSNDSANIVLIDEDDFHVARSRGDNKIATQELVGIRLGRNAAPALEQMRQSCQPVVLGNLEMPNQKHSDSSAGQMRSYLGAPIILQDEVIGFINIFCHLPNCFEQSTAERLKAFAAQAAIAIQNARLYRRSKELAAIQERQRLAREMHDSVSQTLFSAQTMAEASLRQWMTNPTQAHSLLKEVYRMVTSALAEMRVLLLELRPASLTQVGLKQLFEQYLQATLANQDIRIHFEIEDLPPLSSDLQIALYRIVQEAVNNVVKHADARTISVRARQSPQALVLTVHDDGRGFSTDDQRPTSLGLNIMRERAESIGAQFNIESNVGQGTKVVLMLPLNEVKE